MLRFYSRIYLLVFLSGFSIYACSILGLQSKKEAPDPSTPDCKKNYTKKGNFISGRVYNTWVEYENLDFKKGFDTAVMTIQARGNRLISTDRASGMIKAEMAFDDQKETLHPIEIKLVKEKTSLIIHVSSKTAGGDSGSVKLCGFYEEFEKRIKKGVAASQPKQPVVTPKKPPEPEKDSTPSPMPASVAAPKPSPPPSPSPTPKISLPQAEVIWPSVNLREGPGINYKVVGQVKKGTSFTILEEKNGWFHARLADGKDAWISKSATSEAPKTSASPSAPSPPSPGSSKTTPTPKEMSPM